MELPVPSHFDARRVGEIRRVDYAALSGAAAVWARRQGVQPAAHDRFRVCLLAVDVQNTFCLPDFELYVGGASGRAAVEDTRRLCVFLYRNLAMLTRIVATLDTHRAMQIFHPVFFVDVEGRHPEPYTRITSGDIESGRWRFNPALADAVNRAPEEMRRHLLHYTRTLEKRGKYALTVWPYHAMLGGIGHALVPAMEEAIFFHAVARQSQPLLHVKGEHPLTEHYSALGPEIAADADGRPLGSEGSRLLRELRSYDAVIVAGEAKSHCVAWTVEDFLERAPGRAERVYLLEDCTSPVVVPGAADYTTEADEAFHRFAEKGAHVVRSTDPVASWPGVLGRQVS